MLSINYGEIPNIKINLSCCCCCCLLSPPHGAQTLELDLDWGDSNLSSASWKLAVLTLGKILFASSPVEHQSINHVRVVKTKRKQHSLRTEHGRWQMLNKDKSSKTRLTSSAFSTPIFSTYYRWSKSLKWHKANNSQWLHLVPSYWEVKGPGARLYKEQKSQQLIEASQILNCSQF